LHLLQFKVSWVWVNRYRENFRLECNFSNIFEDKISIGQDIRIIKLNCDGCQTEMIDSLDGVEEDNRLDRIRKALSKYYPLRKDLDYEGKDAISLTKIRPAYAKIN